MAPPSTTGSGASDDLTSRVLKDRYRLNRVIASGGMATVWESTDQLLARRVAVKILHPHLAQNASFVRRFQGEAVAAARLTHPSIVSVYDTVVDGSTNAIVMELVSGTTLRADIDEHGPLQLHAVLAIGTQVADALGAAHASGLVHRDVKPANILLSADGRVLVADFGIAKAAQGSDLTEAGSMVGTAKYLSPEQIEGGTVDGRSDLYSLGIVLYEALTGVPPFVADNDVGTALARLRQDPVPPRQRRPEIPEGVEHVVLRAMARRPDDRFPNSEAMRRALMAAGADPARASSFARAAVAASSGEFPVASRNPRTAPPNPPRPAVAPAPPAPARTPAPARPVVSRTAPPATAAGPNAPYRPPSVAPEPKRRSKAGLVAVAILAVGAIAGGLVWAQGRSGESSPGKPLPIASVVDFDPGGGDGENSDQITNLTDPDPASTWRTENYRFRPDLSKGGVGFIATLDGPHDVASVVLQTPVGGWSADVFVSAEDQSPGTLDAWGPKVGEATDVAEGEVNVRLTGASGKHVLIWFTRLAPSGDNVYGVQIGDVAVKGS